MKNSEFDSLPQPGKLGAPSMYCMATLVAEEATRNGFKDLATTIETAIGSFLSGLTRDEQRQALRLSYEMALGGDSPAPPRLRLAYSRD